ncbi:unnamed protein product, partial [Nesidiocoris tenuis]
MIEYLTPVQPCRSRYPSCCTCTCRRDHRSTQDQLQDYIDLQGQMNYCNFESDQTEIERTPSRTSSTLELVTPRRSARLLARRRHSEMDVS